MRFFLALLLAIVSIGAVGTSLCPFPAPLYPPFSLGPGLLHPRSRGISPSLCVPVNGPEGYFQCLSRTHPRSISSLCLSLAGSFLSVMSYTLIG